MAEEDEADDDVGGDDVQVAEELGQHPRDVAERTLQRSDTQDNIQIHVHLCTQLWATYGR